VKTSCAAPPRRSARAPVQHGLSQAEAARRLAARGPAPKQNSSRSYASIVRANVLTVFNLILGIMGGLTLAFADWEDALFLGVLFSNSAVGIVQEVRAKRALDGLAALVRPTGSVVREGQSRSLSVDQIVVGDVITVAPGDQIVADGLVLDAAGLSLDESILTGESRSVSRLPGANVLSGAFITEGSGSYEVTAVGPDSYAARITGEARRFRHPRSPLELALNRLLLALLALIVPLGALTGFALWERDTPLREAMPTAVASVVTLVPEGLILLASLTFAVAALRMARRGALAQQLNAIESFASVDVLCLDKTGTLTEAGLEVLKVVPSEGVSAEQLTAALACYAASTPRRNSTLEAISRSFSAEPASVGRQVPFSSRWRWSALELDGRLGVLGAPELFRLDRLASVATDEARRGRRVLAFGWAAVPAAEIIPAEGVPDDLQTTGLVILAERLRPDARETVAFFQMQGVELKILSGDRAETVESIAEDVGLRSDAGARDASDLPDDPDDLRKLALETTVFGRISPAGKRRVVEALRDAGRYVAMVGDGVNDVPALKAARLAIAQGSGTQMAKSVADVVLVRGDFSSVPAMVAEGRQVLRNLQRVAKLFLTKSAFATFLILSIGLTPTAYPLLPRHLTLIASLTIGIPAFFLALAASSGPYEPRGFLRETARFAIPAGTAAGLGVVASYFFALNVADLPLRESRTVAATVLLVVGLYLVLALEASAGRRGVAVTTLCVLMASLYVLVLVLPWLREFFALSHPTLGIVGIALAGSAIAVAGLAVTDDRFVPGRPH
jgi:magnesium-transporting ATPase (P-type)